MIPSLSQLPDWGVSTTNIPLPLSSSMWAAGQPAPIIDHEEASDSVLEGTPSFIYSPPSTWGRLELRATPDSDPSSIYSIPEDADAQREDTPNHHQTTTTHLTTKTMTTMHKTTRTNPAEIRRKSKREEPATTSLPTTSSAITSSAPTTNGPEATESSDPEETLAIQVTVGGAPTICHSSAFALETKVSTPQGIFRVGVGHESTGWGKKNTTWTFSISPGAKLLNVTAPCQGSGCTELGGKENKQNDGKLEEKNGVWELTIPDGFSDATRVVGIVVADGTHTKRDAIKYDLTIKAHPPCGPIAESCVKGNMERNVDQWYNRKTDAFVKKYLNMRPKITNLDQLRLGVIDDFYSPTSKNTEVCDITGEPFDCGPLKDIMPVCQWRAQNPQALEKFNNDEEASGLMLAHSVMRLTQFLRSMWKVFDRVKAKVKDKVPMIVKSVTIAGEKAEAAYKRSLGSILSFVSVLLGFLTAAMVVVDALVPPPAKPAVKMTFGLVAGAIGGGAAIGTAGNVISDKENQGPSEAEKLFMLAATERDGINNLTDTLQDKIVEIYKDQEWSKDGLARAFQGGGWLSDDIQDHFNKQGNGDKIADWFTKYLLAHYISSKITEQGGFIVVLRYGDEIMYGGEKFSLHQEDCERRFRDNKNWKYAVVCDMDLPREVGVKAMAVLLRPNSQGSESQDWVDPDAELEGQQIQPSHIIASSVWGHYEDSYESDLMNQDWGSFVSGGLDKAKKLYEDKSLKQTGLFKIRVCEITDMAEIPHIGKVRKDWADSHQSPELSGLYQTENPCSCAHYSYTAPNGRTGKFVDYVSDKVGDAVSKDCKMTGRTQTAKRD